ncbi:MAG: 3'-5' exonuclease [Bacteroidota bacterium]
MLDNIQLENILFLDIETVPNNSKYNELNEGIKKLWDKKAKHLSNSDEETPESLYQRAGIYAEFGKIICISIGIFRKDENGKYKIRIKSFYSHNEKELLTNFIELLNNKFNKAEHLLCAHNGKEFDFPYIARRILINRLKLPVILDNAGKKPWEIKHLDTLELWKFGDYKSYTSLELLCCIFNIPTPKDDIDGSQVGKVYWEDNDLERIVTYCQKDVISIAQLVLSYRGEALIVDENIEYS